MTSTRQGCSEPPLRATPAARDLVRRLQERHGELRIFQSGGCCDGSLPSCLRAGDLPAGPHDVLLGTVEGAPVYIDAEQHRRWREPAFTLDVAPGEPEGMSLGLADAHLISRQSEVTNVSPPRDSGVRGR